ncbi:MAG: GDSL-type esterase/lipase family protein [Methylacidiphilales bacterium]|nr:GDSL-type esterase/lipase family protein [Candidatus Methylacidiphilales bacterium]
MKPLTLGLLLFTLLVSSSFAQTETRQITLPWPPPPASATKPSACNPEPRYDWIGQFESNIDKLKNGPYDLIFDGDSITDNWQSEGKKVWDEHYGNLKAIDIGIGGDQVQHVLWRAQNGALAGQDPKLIVVMIGTNNIGQKAEDVAAGIKLLLGEYESRCPNAHILLLGIFPRDPSPASPARAWVASVNRIISTYDSDKRIIYRDFGAKFLESEGDDTIPKDVMRDGLHPTAKGYTIWADAIQPIINQYFPSAATDASPTPAAQ